MKMKPVSILNVLFAVCMIACLSFGGVTTMLHPAQAETLPALSPPAGLQVTPLFKEPLTDTDALLKRLEDAVQEERNNVDAIISTLAHILPTTASAPPPVNQLPAQNVATVNAIPPELAEEAARSEAEKKIVTREGPNGKITYVERPEDSQLVVELALDNGETVFDEAMPVYLVNETALVPLGKLAAGIGFPITVDTSKGTAEGWFLAPENTFRLSSPYNFIEIAGKNVPIRRPGIVETHLDDIYVSLDLLNSWLPIGMTLNYHELRLYIKPLVDLPVQERAKRHDRWEAFKSALKQPGLEYDPKDIIKLPHRMYAAPALQVTHAYGHARTPTGSTTSTTSTSLNANTDLLGMSARGSLSFSSSTKGREEIQGIQFNLSKEDYEGNLLGRLHATQFALGDVSAYPFPLAAPGSGRGFTITNQPYNFVSDAANFRISGFGTAGWEVEIFQSSELIAFSSVGMDGRYDFTTLPLKGGFNLFKIVLYGPNGEKEIRYERFYLGQDMVPKGKTYYTASALQSSTPLFDVSVNPAGETPSTAALTGEYGISKYLSASAGVFHGPISDTMLDGVGLGLRSSGSRVYAQMNAFLDKSGGQSASGLVTGNLTETMTVNIQDQAHRSYAPGVYATSRNSTVQVSNLFNFKSEIIPDINMTLKVGRERSETGTIKLAYIGRLATNFLGLSVSNELERDLFSGTSPDTYIGNLSARIRTPAGALQSEMRYNFHNPFEWKNGTLNLQTDLTKALTLTTGINHTFGLTPMTALKTTLDWKLDKARMSLTGSTDNTHNKQVGLSIIYNLTPRTLYGDYAIADISDDITNGRLIIRPFIDQNGNGTHDKGEPLLKDVQFRNQMRGSRSTITRDGTIIMPGLVPNLANSIVVEESSISDIFLAPRKKTLVVLGKTGVNGPIDFAFTRMGEIMGNLVTTDPATGEEIALAEVHMILLDQEGKQVADAYSESDGFFSFDSIPVSNYEVFFPVSETLQKYYAGNGQGPALNISFDNPGLSDIKIRVEHDRILLDGAPGESVKAPEGQANDP